MELKTHEGLTIAENETVVKSWTYATGEKKAKSSHQLIVTDKRVIAIDHKHNRGGSAVERNEIKNTDIVGVSCSNGTISRFILGCVFIAIGVLMFLVGVFGLPDGLFAILVAGIFGVIGALFIKGLGEKYSLSVTIATKSNHYTTFSCCANTKNKTKGFSFFQNLFSRNNCASLKVKVDKNAAEEIVSVLGALLLTDK